MKFTNLFPRVLGLLLAAGVSVAAPTTELAKRTARDSPPAGCLVVRGTGTQSGEFSTLGAAVKSLSTSSTASACIFMYAGTYNEAVVISYKGSLFLYGESSDTGTYKGNMVTIQRSLSSPAAGNLDASATVQVTSTLFRAYSINFSNTFGQGAQAVAVDANGDQQGYYACGFFGFQDTLYAKTGRQYYSNCYIEGAVDYAFGDASAWFGECTFASNGGGAITATSRLTNAETTWYVIDHSTVTAASGFTLTEEVYLGRPWRNFSRVIYQFSDLTDVVNPLGWTTLSVGATPIYEEWENTGAGASTSKRVMETTATGPVTKDTVFGSGWEDWLDTSF